jgi:hypothetical protein
VPGYWITRICTRPNFDSNLDGAIDERDSYVQIWNGNTAGLVPVGWRLAFANFPAANICNTTDVQKTFIFSNYSYLYPQRGKVIYGSDLHNLVGEGFDMPESNAFSVVALCDEAGNTQDSINYVAQNGVCLDIPR